MSDSKEKMSLSPDIALPSFTTPPSAGKGKYTCTQCNYVTDRMGNLEFHRKSHTGTPPSTSTSKTLAKGSSTAPQAKGKLGPKLKFQKVASPKVSPNQKIVAKQTPVAETPPKKRGRPLGSTTAEKFKIPVSSPVKSPMATTTQAPKRGRKRKADNDLSAKIEIMQDWNDEDDDEDMVADEEETSSSALLGEEVVIKKPRTEKDLFDAFDALLQSKATNAESSDSPPPLKETASPSITTQATSEVEMIKTKPTTVIATTTAAPVTPPVTSAPILITPGVNSSSTATVSSAAAPQFVKETASSATATIANNTIQAQVAVNTKSTTVATDVSTTSAPPSLTIAKKSAPSTNTGTGSIVDVTDSKPTLIVSVTTATPVTFAPTITTQGVNPRVSATISFSDAPLQLVKETAPTATATIANTTQVQVALNTKPATATNVSTISAPPPLTIAKKSAPYTATGTGALLELANSKTITTVESTVLPVTSAPTLTKPGVNSRPTATISSSAAPLQLIKKAAPPATVMASNITTANNTATSSNTSTASNTTTACNTTIASNITTACNTTQAQVLINTKVAPTATKVSTTSAPLHLTIAKKSACTTTGSGPISKVAVSNPITTVGSSATFPPVAATPTLTTPGVNSRPTARISSSAAPLQMVKKAAPPATAVRSTTTAPRAFTTAPRAITTAPRAVTTATGTTSTATRTTAAQVQVGVNAMTTPAATKISTPSAPPLLTIAKKSTPPTSTGTGAITEVASSKPTATIKPTVTGNEEEPLIRQALQVTENLEGNLKSSPERPENVAEKVVHLLPVENADGSVTYMFIQMEDNSNLRVDELNGTIAPNSGADGIYVDQTGNLNSVFGGVVKANPASSHTQSPSSSNSKPKAALDVKVSSTSTSQQQQMRAAAQMPNEKQSTGLPLSVVPQQVQQLHHQQQEQIQVQSRQGSSGEGQQIVVQEDIVADGNNQLVLGQRLQYEQPGEFFNISDDMISTESVESFDFSQLAQMGGENQIYVMQEDGTLIDPASLGLDFQQFIQQQR